VGHPHLSRRARRSANQVSSGRRARFFVIRSPPGFLAIPPALGYASSNRLHAVMSAKTWLRPGMLRDQGQLTESTPHGHVRRNPARSITYPVPSNTTRHRRSAAPQAHLQARPDLASSEIADRAGRALIADAAAWLVWRRWAARLSLSELCARAELIVTTTPSTVRYLHRHAYARKRICRGRGRAPGKRELYPAILARGRVVG